MLELLRLNLHMPRSTHLQLVSSPSPMTLGAAIAKAVRDSDVRTQENLADRLGIDQTTVSKWIRGKVAVAVDRVREIEDECGLPRGQILRWSGYVDGQLLREVAIAATSGNVRGAAKDERPRPRPR